MNSRVTVIAGAAALALVACGGGWWLLRPPPGANAALSGDDGGDPLPLPPVPTRIAEGAQYDECLGMLGSDPSGANSLAEAWEAAGGGDGAAHCHALAQIALGSPATGAEMLQTLAGTSHAAPLVRASLYAQADQAWLMAGDSAAAYAAATRALALSADDADTLIDRGIAASNLGRYADASDDLSRALALDPRRADALVLRAAAWRHLGRIDRATDDIDRAFLIDADNPDALLERGILRERAGDRDGARADWQRALDLDPDSQVGDLAQQNLALLEAGPAR